ATADTGSSASSSGARGYASRAAWFYAVARGRVPGVYVIWDECKAQVDYFQGSKYKKFTTKSEADDFIAANR
ncbi:unnamed protein product, partial [Polarella glacialis]